MKKENLTRIFANLPTIKTERLILRKMLPEDAEDMFEYASDESVTKYLLWSAHKNLAHTKEYLKYIKGRYLVGDFYDWAIVDAADGKMIGTCGFSKIDLTNNLGQIGYVLNPEYHKRGYAPEAARAIIEFGFSKLGLNRVEAEFIKENTPSYKVMQKLGMTFEGYRHDALFIKGSYVTVGVCSILRKKYDIINE